MASTSVAVRPSASRADSVLSTPDARRVDSRNASTESGSHETYEAVVVGAGPAGITAVGNLLDNRIDRILWVDEAFEGGRMHKYYREVPSNTKVKLFAEWATGFAPFRKIVSGVPSRDRWEEPSASDSVTSSSENDKLQDLRRLDQEKGCQLSHAADVCLMLTEGLKRTPGVVAQRGRVSEAVLDESSSTWDVGLSEEADSTRIVKSARSKRIVFCTGASPNDPPLPFEPAGLQHIDLDVALSPTRLSQLLSPSGSTTVSVIGASHSAILVLWNLARLALSSKPDLKIQWFTRHPLRYAEYHDSFIARDNTGLKGGAAQWAKDNLEPDTLPRSPVSKVLTKIAYKAGDEEKVYREHLPGTQFVIQAIGYKRDPTPTLKLTSGEEIQPVFDHNKGTFSSTKNGALAHLPGVFGAGIAFPEKVVDKKYGHEEMNVGFFKFMKAVKKWAGEWNGVAA